MDRAGWERLDALELVLMAALRTSDSKTRNEMLCYLKARTPTGSCGDGSFERKQQKQYELSLERAMNFISVGDYVV